MMMLIDEKMKICDELFARVQRLRQLSVFSGIVGRENKSDARFFLEFLLYK